MENEFLTEDIIRNLIESYKDGYIAKPSFMTSAYRREKKTTEEYIGRELLELIQNADDAKSDIVEIILNKNEKKLVVSNNGNPFTKGGLESLMESDFSEKPKGLNIGNKGLGFRSILNWSDEVTVLSKNFSFGFSREYIERFFQTEFADDFKIQIKNIRKEKFKDSTTEFLIPTLAFPEIKSERSQNYTTEVVIHYHEKKEESILNQLKEITSETLLFLPTINEIKIIIDNEAELKLIKKVEDGLIEILDSLQEKEIYWNINSGSDWWEDNSAERKKVEYKFSIAWQDNLSDSSVLYNYFATEEKIFLPSIIHAQFDLNSNRNTLNKTDYNKAVLSKLVEELKIITETKIKKQKSDWSAYYFLTPLKKNEGEVFKDFYKQLEYIKEEIGVYPTLDGKYVTKEKSHWHGEEFSAWVEENDFGEYFSGLLKVDHSEFKQPLHHSYRSYTANKLLEISKMISSKIKNHEERAKLIKIFANDDFVELHNSAYKLPLLINEDFKFNDGEYDDTVFGVKELPKGFVPLEYLKVLFINQDFLEALFKVFSTGINEIQEDRKQKGKAKEDKVRTLEGLVRNVVDLGLDDLTQIVEFIVKGTNQKIDDIESEVDKVVIVKEMVTSLYSLYNNTTDRTSVKNIPLLSRSNGLTTSDKLKFGNDFLPELCTETIFEGVYDDSDYLNYHLIEDVHTEEEAKSLVRFYHWLGVNKLIGIDHIKDKYCYSGRELEYFKFLFETKNCEKHDNAKHDNTLLSSSLIKDDNLLNQLKLEKIVLLLGKSSFLCRSISLNNDDDEMSKMTYKYGNSYPKPIKIPFSFIYFQIYKTAEFQKYTISEDSDLSVLFERINLNDEVYNILTPEEKKRVKEVLRRLGTAESIEDISEGYLINLLKNQDALVDSKDSRKLYEKCMEYYLKSDREESGIAQQSLKFYARKGSEPYELIDKNEVYYSDNMLLPKKILNNFDFINLPSRIGEDNVKTIFGIKLIKDEILNIEVKRINENNGSKSLSDEINKLKPYFLAYRLKAIKQLTQRQIEVKYLKELSIQLVTDLTYSFQGSDFQLNTNEFIPIKGVFYVKSKLNSIEYLKQDLDFCDAIAEIVGMIFKISNLNNEYYSIFKAQTIRDVKHGIIRNNMEELLNEAKKHLGVSAEQQNLWIKIFPSEGLKDISDENNFKTKLKELLSSELPENYNEVDFSDFNNEVGVEFLRWIEEKFSHIKLESLLPNAGLNSWHRRKLENEVSTLDILVKKSLWSQANEGNLELKKQFFRKYEMYQKVSITDSFSDFLNENKFKLRPNYEKEIRNYCQNNFKIDTSTEVDLELKNYHDLLFSKDENIFAPVSDMKKTLKDNDLEVYILLYFEGVEFEKLIEEKLKELVQQFKESNSENIEDKTDGIEFTASFGTMLTKTHSSLKNSRNKSNSGSVTEKTKRESVKKGLECENKVKKFFEKNNYDYIPISETTDAFHYDYRYKKKEETEWRFLEVKTDSGGYFYLSNAEKETGTNVEYRDRYDIAVVSGSHIQFFKKPFVTDIDSEFKAIPNDYVVYFEVDNK